MLGRIMPQIESLRCTRAEVRYSGTVIAVIGTSSAAITSRNIALDPKNENRAKPYPAKAASTVAPPQPASAYSAVFANHWVNVPYPSTSWNSSEKLWKNSNGLANQKPNDSKMLA